eukprot:14974540-Heterocapsa_arctica.AAC.1
MRRRMYPNQNTEFQEACTKHACLLLYYGSDGQNLYVQQLCKDSPWLFNCFDKDTLQFRPGSR